MTTMIRTDRKKRIIAAAIKLWQQAHNVNKVSLADIAREAGVSPTTVYNQFGTREGLVHEVIRHLFEDILEKQKAILKSDLPFPEKIQSLISAKMKPIKGIELDLVDKICIDPVDKQYVEDVTVKEFKPMMRAVIREGKREGYIRPETPDEVIMLYLDVLKSGGVTCSEEMKRILADRNTMLAFTKLIYFGLFQKEFKVSLNNTDKRS